MHLQIFVFDMMVSKIKFPFYKTTKTFGVLLTVFKEHCEPASSDVLDYWPSQLRMMKTVVQNYIKSGKAALGYLPIQGNQVMSYPQHSCQISHIKKKNLQFIIKTNYTMS